MPTGLSTPLFIFRISGPVTFPVQSFYHGWLVSMRVVSMQVVSAADLTYAKGKGPYLDRGLFGCRCDFWYYNEDSSAKGYMDLKSFAKLAMYI